MYVITDELYEEIGNAIIKWNALAVKIVLDKLLSEARHIDIKDFEELKEILDTMGYMQTGEYMEEGKCEGKSCT